VMELAGLGTGNRLNVHRPPPARFVSHPPNNHIVEFDHINLPVRKGSNLGGCAKPFALQTRHDLVTSFWSTGGQNTTGGSACQDGHAVNAASSAVNVCSTPLNRASRFLKAFVPSARVSSMPRRCRGCCRRGRPYRSVETPLGS
jgi:hypothetical protein